MGERYNHDITCWNCGKLNQLLIPMGETVDDFLDRTKCTKCGCHCRLK